MKTTMLTPCSPLALRPLLISTALCVLVLTACRSAAVQDSTAAVTLTVVSPLSKPVTIAEGTEPPELPPKLTLPSELLQHYYIARAHSPLRYGPGLQFPIQAKLRDYGEHAILLGKEAAWRKVFLPQSQEVGWLHAKALLPKADLAPTLTVPTAALTLLHTKNRVHTLATYPHKTKMPVVIPKATPLIHLQSQQGSVLVWIPHNNAIAWLTLADLH